MLKNFRTLLLCSIVLQALLLTGCVTNAVTGERNLQFYGSDWEQQVGTQMYAPMKQSQGGEFVLDPELTDYVNSVGQRLANQARRKDELQFEFSILNSSVPNAWALPGGKIVVNRGLLTELDSEAELAAVLGHEIVHADAAHGAQQQSTGMLAQLGAVASMVVLGSTVENQTAREVAMMVPTLGAQLIMQRYGREAERESDEYGMLYMSEAGYDPQGAIELQQTFVKLSENRNDDWLSGLFASHPPSRERVENNIETAAGLPSGGDSGRERYRQKTAYLQRVKPAYEAYDEASKAAADNNLKLAQEKLDLALSIEPRESMFMALQGDLHEMRDQPKAALASYSRAIKANDGFFYPWLRQGQVAYELNQRDTARRSLEKSLQLLPTSQAHYLLGLMDRDSGRKDLALQHFQQAAQSQSEAGKKAQREMVLLDVDQNPSKYLAVQAAVDRSNAVWIQLANQTQVDFDNIVVQLVWLDEQGQTRRDAVNYRGTLPAGKQDNISTRLTLNNPNELRQRVRVEIQSARVAQ